MKIITEKDIEELKELGLTEDEIEGYIEYCEEILIELNQIPIIRGKKGVEN